MRPAPLLPALLLAALAVAGAAASAHAATHEVRLVSDLGWSFRAEITVRNDAAGQRLDAWTLVLDWPGRTLSNVQGARMILGPEPGRVTFEPPAKAAALPPGGAITFTVAGTPGDTPLPALIRLDAATSPAPASAAAAPPRKGCRQANAVLTFTTDKTWDGGYTGRIDIVNKDTAPLTDWLLTFNLADPIPESWDGTVLTKSGTAYAIKPADYFQTVAPGAAARFVFNAKPDDPKAPAKAPGNMRVYGCG